MRPRLFIASASERLKIAETIQFLLGESYLTTVWNQGVFELSGYAIPSLLQRCSETDFAIAILGPDAVQQRGDGVEVFVPNANVMFEIGLFMGALGQKRVFVLAPTIGSAKIEVPSDMHGLTILPYAYEREDGNFDAAMAPAVHKLRQEMNMRWKEVGSSRPTMSKLKLFNNTIDSDLAEMLAGATEFETLFVHSRRWRETHADGLRERLQSGQLKTMQFYFPDIRSVKFIRELSARFNDAHAIPAFIYDAYAWLDDIAKSGQTTVKLYLYDRIPMYSFYVSQKMAVMAFYTLTEARKPVPALIVGEDGEIRDFLKRDIADFRAKCSELPVSEIAGVNSSYKRSMKF